jgi:hypothetical protein
MTELERWRSRPLQVRVLTRCDECGELKDDVRERVNYWPNIKAVCCAACFAEMTGDRQTALALHGVNQAFDPRFKRRVHSG